MVEEIEREAMVPSTLDLPARIEHLLLSMIRARRGNASER
jgi:hypothetical protein